MSTWKYMQNGQPCGPVDDSAVKALIANGTLNPESKVCKEGTSEWFPISTVPELSGAAAAGTALPPTPPPAGAPASSPTPPSAGEEKPDPADVEKNKVFAILAYLGILFLVPLLAAPQSKFARYHTNQGLILFLASLIVSVAGFILSFVPFLGCLIWPAIFVAVLVFVILGIINAAGGHYKPLPLIGQFELIK